MDSNLINLIDSIAPKTNEVICKSIAAKHFSEMENYIYDVFNSFNEGAQEIDVRFVRFSKCTPMEEYAFATAEKSGKRTFNMAKSDIKLYKFIFSFQGKELPPRYIYLPFVNENGFMHLSGTSYLISPIVTDKIISPNKNSVFVRLLRDKVIFSKTIHPIIADNKVETYTVVYSNVYRQKKKGRTDERISKAETIVLHYLLAKDGLTKTFDKYLGFVPIYGSSDRVNENNYPKETHTIFRSTGIKPKGFIGKVYTPTNLVLAVPNEYVNNESKTFIASLYYLVDNFPKRLTENDLEDTLLLKVLLGHIIFNSHYLEKKLKDLVVEHFESLSFYMDNYVIKKLAELGYVTRNFFELLATVIKEFNNWNMDIDRSLTMFNKEISILYHSLFAITSALFRVNFRLNKLATRKPLTEKDVINMLQTNLKTGLVYDLSKSHVSASSVSYSGDNAVFKLSTLINVSTVSNNTKKRSESDGYMNPKNKIHASIAFVNGHLTVAKRSERGTGRLNIYATTDDSYSTTTLNPKFKDLYVRTQQYLTQGVW